VIALVQTGVYSAASKEPDDRGIDAFQGRLNRMRRRSASQKGSTPMSSRNDGR